MQIKTDETNKYEIHESVLYLIDDLIISNYIWKKYIEDIIY